MLIFLNNYLYNYIIQLDLAFITFSRNSNEITRIETFNTTLNRDRL